jgi:hypothetical protein
VGELREKRKIRGKEEGETAAHSDSYSSCWRVSGKGVDTRRGLLWQVIAAVLAESVVIAPCPI